MYFDIVTVNMMMVAGNGTTETLMMPLLRAQGMALQGVVGAMRSTLTAAIEIPTGNLPIELRLQQVSINTILRLQLSNRWLCWKGVG
jgi:hypothetical protein